MNPEGNPRPPLESVRVYERLYYTYYGSFVYPFPIDTVYRSNEVV